MTPSITSIRNPLLKEIRLAIAQGALTENGYAVAESFHLLEEALRSDCEVAVVLAADSVKSIVARHIRNLTAVKFIPISDEVFQQFSSTETSQGVIALVKPPVWNIDHLCRGRTLLVVLDGVQDPGNAGNILRSAEAFGATGALFLKGCVNPYNPKTLRASAGSIFRLPVVYSIDADLARTTLQQRCLDVYTAMPDAAMVVENVDFTRKFALVVGSEGRGVSERMRGIAMDVTIPTSGVESLNAAMAAGVILYEASRQRRAAGAVT